MASPLPPTMRAIQWTAPFSKLSSPIESSITYTPSAPLPPCEALPPNSALIKVAYASLNPVDFKLPEVLPYRLINYSLSDRPLIPCGDYAGTVITSNIDGIEPGERVFGRSDPPFFGALAEYMVVRGGRENVVKIPEAVGMREACTVGVAGLTALQCLETMETAMSSTGDEGGKKRVLINGASGGTGTFGVQIAKILGWEVVGTCSTGNVEFVKGLGADGVVDYRKENVVEELKRRAREDGKFDLLIDNVDSPELFWGSEAWLSEGGKYVTIAGNVSLGFFRKIGTMMYLPKILGGMEREARFLRRKSARDGFERIAAWMAEGKLKPVIAKEYSLEDAKEAFVELKKGRVRGKLIVSIANEE